jgi:Ribonuclease G/E
MSPTKNAPRSNNEFATKRAVERKIEELENRRDRQINKLNQEICVLIAELNEQMVYNVQQANNDSVRQFLKNDLESKFLYTMETAGFALDFAHTVSNGMGEKLEEIAKKQAQIEQIIVETQIARRTLDEMVTFQ